MRALIEHVTVVNDKVDVTVGVAEVLWLGC